MTFYNKDGKPIAYTNEKLDIYLFDGTPVAYIADKALYSFKGKHLGCFEDGWIRDLKGKCVFYTDNCSGGPITPITRIEPIKSVQRVQPVKSVQEVQRVRAVDTFNWSELSDKSFFLN